VYKYQNRFDLYQNLAFLLKDMAYALLAHLLDLSFVKGFYLRINFDNGEATERSFHDKKHTFGRPQ
jgi:hypothetical protein